MKLLQCYENAKKCSTSERYSKNIGAQRSPIERHSRTRNCSFVDCRLLKEVKHGLSSKLVFECSKCERKNLSLNLCDEFDMINLENDELDLTYSTVLGAITIGCGFSQLEEFFGILNISPMGPAL